MSNLFIYGFLPCFACIPLFESGFFFKNGMPGCFIFGSCIASDYASFGVRGAGSMKFGVRFLLLSLCSSVCCCSLTPASLPSDLTPRLWKLQPLKFDLSMMLTLSSLGWFLPSSFAIYSSFSLRALMRAWCLACSFSACAFFYSSLTFTMTNCPWLRVVFFGTF